jgi:hypothetical protein
MTLTEDVTATSTSFSGNEALDVTAPVTTSNSLPLSVTCPVIP